MKLGVNQNFQIISPKVHLFHLRIEACAISDGIKHMLCFVPCLFFLLLIKKFSTNFHHLLHHFLLDSMIDHLRRTSNNLTWYQNKDFKSCKLLHSVVYSLSNFYTYTRTMKKPQASQALPSSSTALAR